MPPKTRRPSKADNDPDIIRIKAIRDGIADKEKAGEACKGLYKCHKSPKPERDKCIKTIEEKLKALQKKGGAARRKSPKGSAKRKGSTKRKGSKRV